MSYIPSVNIELNTAADFRYIVTENARMVAGSIVNNYNSGHHSFSIIGTYGTGKSSFILALEEDLLSGANRLIKKNVLGPVSGFEFLNIVGDYSSLSMLLASKLGSHNGNAIDALNQYYQSLRKRNKFLIIVIDEFGKVLEHAANNNPEKELYFLQKLSEFVNVPSRNIILLTTLHQNFGSYAYKLNETQRNEWLKVKGRFQEIVFAEPVEQLLYLTTKQLSGQQHISRSENTSLSLLYELGLRSKILSSTFNLKTAELLYPLDPISAVCLTLAVQRYGQNERSLFSFLTAKGQDSLGEFKAAPSLTYNVAKVYDYLTYHFYSAINEMNADSTGWRALSVAIERIEGSNRESTVISDCLMVIKTIGLINMFFNGIVLNDGFLITYGENALGIDNVENIIKILLSDKIIRFASYKSHYQNFEPPFPIPDSWEWVRLEDIAYVASGSTPSKESFTDSGIPYLKMYNLRNQKIDFDYHPQYISEDVHNGKLARSRAQSGDLIMNIVGPPLGKLAIIPESIQHCNFNQAAVMIRPYSEVAILNQYLFFYLSEMSEIDSIVTKGTAGQSNISLSQSQNMRIPVPPLGEMERINDTVRILISLIEDIENYTCGIQTGIRAVKNKILELAMQGKLVPQDQADEAAADMLLRINPKAKIITDNPHSWNIPNNWCWTRVKDVFNPMEKAVPSDSEFFYIDIDSVDNRTNTVSPKQIKTEYAPSRASRKTQRGDIVFSMVRPYLRNVAVVPFDGCIASTGFYVLSRSSAIYPPFAFRLALSEFFVSGLNSYMKGDNSPSINKSDMEELIIPLPPFNEQKRIILKIDDMLSLIDSIKASL